MTKEQHSRVFAFSAAEMAGEYPIYYKNPIRWARYHAYTRPHLFYACAIGIAGPVLLLVGPDLRRKFLFQDHVPLPSSYPLPKRPREQLTGYDDE